MSELQNITKEVPPTSFFSPKLPPSKPIEEMYNDLISVLNLNVDETIKFKEGVSLEKLKQTPTLKILLETIIVILDNSQKNLIGDKNDDALYLQNKKIVREIAFNLFQLLSNFNYDDRQTKSALTGKLIQSLYGSK
jgi:hypothetical protein